MNVRMALVLALAAAACASQPPEPPPTRHAADVVMLEEMPAGATALRELTVRARDPGKADRAAKGFAAGLDADAFVVDRRWEEPGWCCVKGKAIRFAEPLAESGER